ncbi:hypothetical protein MASR2M8_20550 [Opitutaceae bacterium]
MRVAVEDAEIEGEHADDKEREETVEPPVIGKGKEREGIHGVRSSTEPASAAGDNADWIGIPRHVSTRPDSQARIEIAVVRLRAVTAGNESTEPAGRLKNPLPGRFTQ